MAIPYLSPGSMRAAYAIDEVYFHSQKLPDQIHLARIIDEHSGAEELAEALKATIGLLEEKLQAIHALELSDKYERMMWRNLTEALRKYHRRADGSK